MNKTLIVSALLAAVVLAQFPSSYYVDYYAREKSGVRGEKVSGGLNKVKLSVYRATMCQTALTGSPRPSCTLQRDTDRCSGLQTTRLCTLLRTGDQTTWLEVKR